MADRAKDRAPVMPTDGEPDVSDLDPTVARCLLRLRTTLAGMKEGRRD